MSGETSNEPKFNIGREVGAGAAIGDGVKVEAKNIAGRDFIGGDKIGGDKIGGDKIENHFHIHVPREYRIDELYKKCFPQTFEGDRSYESVSQALETLWNVVDPDNRRIGYVSFVESLASIIEKDDLELAKQIRERLHQLSLEPGNRISLADIKDVKSQKEEDSVLLIEIKPGKIREQGFPSEFQVCFYPWLNNAFSERYFEEKWFSIEEVPAHIDTVLNTRYTGSINKLELFVPIDVIVRHSQFDQAEYQDDLSNIYGIDVVPKRFGSVYNIALRSLERQRTRLRHDKNWKNKWDYLTKSSDINSNAHLVSTVATKLENELRNSWPGDEGKALAILKITENNNIDAKLKVILGSLFGAGVPVILWSRKTYSSSEEDDDSELRSILLQCNHKTYIHLLKMIHNLRRVKEALENPEHIGNHLTLIWDPPNRMLPDKKEFGEIR